ncbi:hypothetical protein CUZ95_2308 [Enterococcus lactis]|nr:hypothetical protein [Enterococcus lactis]
MTVKNIEIKVKERTTTGEFLSVSATRSVYFKTKNTGSNF